MIGLFVVNTPIIDYLPPMDADEETDEMQLHYEYNGEMRGGFWCAAPADNSPTQIVVIDALDENILDAIADLDGCERLE